MPAEGGHLIITRFLIGPAIVGAAVWCASGHITVVDAASSSARIATPAPWWLFLAAVGLALVVPSWRLRPSHTLPALLTTMPWWPAPLPAIAMIFTGPLAWLPIAAVVLVAAAPGIGRAAGAIVAMPPRRATAAIGAATLVLSIATAWSIAPRLPGGDEPHYLVITQSVWLDGDLRIQNNHDRRDYAMYFGGTLRPDVIQRGRDGEVYSIHAPGTSVLVLPAFVLFGYAGAQATIALCSMAAAMLIWCAAYRLARSAAAAWFATTAVVLTPTFLLQSVMVFPDGPGLLGSAAGLWLLTRLDQSGAPGRLKPAPPTVVQEAAPPRRWQVVAVACALASMPWLHTRFAVIAAGLGAAIVWRILRRLPGEAGRAVTLASFLAVPIVAAAAWFMYFQTIYGTPSPAAPYGTDGRLTSIWFVPGGVLGVLFDQQFGLLAYSPVLVAALAGAWLSVRVPAARSAVWTSLIIAVAYLAASATYWMWWVGVPASPARLATAALPLLAPALTAAWERSAGTARSVWLAVATVSAAIAGATVFVSRGALAWNPRDAVGRWLDWLGPVADLPRAWPSFFWRLDPADLRTEWAFAAQVVVWWLVPIALAALIARVAARGGWAAARRRVALAWWLCASIPAAAALGWPLQGSTGLDPAVSQVRALADYAAGRTLLRIAAGEWQPEDSTPTAMVIRGADPGRTDEPPPWLALAGVPAGDYALDVVMTAPAAGELLLALGRGAAPERQWTLDATARQTLALSLPAGADRLTIGADRGLAQAGGSVRLRPVLLATDGRGLARASARYGDVAFYFLDDAVFVESAGFWVRGGQTASMVLDVSAAPRRAVDLLIRNGAEPNDVQIRGADGGNSGASFAMGSGQERVISIPIGEARTARVTIDTRTGFRPSETGGSADQRFLGVWVQVR